MKKIFLSILLLSSSYVMDAAESHGAQADREQAERAAMQYRQGRVDLSQVKACPVKVKLQDGTIIVIPIELVEKSETLLSFLSQFPEGNLQDAPEDIFFAPQGATKKAFEQLTYLITLTPEQVNETLQSYSFKDLIAVICGADWLLLDEPYLQIISEVANSIGLALVVPTKNGSTTEVKVSKLLISLSELLTNLIHDVPATLSDPINLPTGSVYLTEETIKQLESIAADHLTFNQIETKIRSTEYSLLDLVYLCNAIDFLDFKKSYDRNGTQVSIAQIIFEIIYQKFLGLNQKAVLENEAQIIAAISNNPALSNYLVQKINSLEFTTLTTLQGNNSGVTAVACSSRNQLATARTENNEVKIWNSCTGECLSTLPHNNQVEALAFSHQSGGVFNPLTTVTHDGSLRVWKHPARCLGTMLHESPFGKGQVASFMLNHAGTVLAIPCQNGDRVKIASSGFYDQSFASLQHNRLQAAAFSPDGRLFATASQDGTVRIWHSVNEHQKFNYFHGRSSLLEGHTGAVSTVQFSPCSRFIVTASHDTTARIWNAETGECLHVLQGHEQAINSAAFNFNGTLLLTISNNGTAKFWNVQTGICIRTIMNVDPLFPATFQYISGLSPLSYPTDCVVMSSQGAIRVCYVSALINQLSIEDIICVRTKGRTFAEQQASS